MITPKQLALIGAIESTPDNYIETQYITLVKSLRRWGGAYKDIDVFLLEPATNIISAHYRNSLLSEGVEIVTHDDANTTLCEYNYNNMPIACNYFSQSISNTYEYLMWLDCDVIILKEPVFEINSSSDVLCFPCEWYFDDKSPGLLHDIEMYHDMTTRAMPELKKKYTPYNTWFIVAHSKNRLWREWYNMTFTIQNQINSQQRQQYMFYKHGTVDFDNRIEEIAFSIVVEDINHTLPKHAGMVHTPDIGLCGFDIDDMTPDQMNCIHHYVDSWNSTSDLCELENDLKKLDTPYTVLEKITNVIAHEQSRSDVYKRGDDMWCIHYNDPQYIDMLGLQSKYKTFIKSIEMKYGCG